MDIELIDAPLPHFSEFDPDDAASDLKVLLSGARQAILEFLGATQPTWTLLENTIHEADDRINNFWSVISHFNSVTNTPEWRAAYEACLPLLTEYSTEVGQNHELYNAYLKLQASTEFQSLGVAARRAITLAIQDFELSGVALPLEEKKIFAGLRQRLSELGNRFSNNVLDATQGWFFQTADDALLSGLPESNMQQAASLANERDVEGWVISLDIPSYLPAMQYLDDRSLRRELYEAYVTRASDNGPLGGEYDNSSIILEILDARQKLASLLSLQSYAGYSLEKKMASTPQEVVGFLRELADKSLPVAKADYAELETFAKSHGIDQLEAWDLAYYSEKLRQEKFDISQDQLRPWFPVEKVVDGLFSVVEKLFAIEIIKDSSVEVWHQDVSFYRINKDGLEVAGFYFDLFARTGKRGGAWMADCRNRCIRNGSLQKPVAFLTCNFAPPAGSLPSLLTHMDVTTLFHEFGHGLHHMLTQIDVAEVSGINGVPWDAVELPSQFLENWCWQKEVIPMISAHYETGEPLPVELLHKLLKAKNFQSGMQMVRQLEFGLFDMLLHMQHGGDVQQLLNDVRRDVAVASVPTFNRFQNSFSHIFAGGYAAGYYSYKWAEVLSADAFSLFEEKGIFDPETGQRFLESILEMGGSENPADLFADFRGREPSAEALLRHSGIQ